jgi:hypothetical protein
MSDAKTEAENRTYYIKASDRKPLLELILYDEDGGVHDLTTDGQMVLNVSKEVGGRRLVDEGAVDFNGPKADGGIKYAWAANELVAGEYLMEVIINHGGSTQETFPKGGYYKLVVVPHL